MSETLGDGQTPSVNDRQQNGVELISRRRFDARKLFEESLQKVTARSSRRDVDSPELMHLLLATDRSTTGTASADGHDDDLHDASISAAADDNTSSVFTSDKLEEYLASDRIQDGPSSAGGLETESGRRDGVKELTDAGTEQAHDSDVVSVVRSIAQDENETRDGLDRNSVVEVDIIDGFSFYSFSTEDALLQHVDGDRAERSSRKSMTDVGLPRLKTFQYGIAGNMVKYMAKMKGWGKRTAMACDQRSDAVDALLSNGMVRQLSDTATLGLSLTPAADNNMVISAGDGGRSAVGWMGNEERQPGKQKGKIYGRKWDGRFVSKANIHYHIKRRRSPTSRYIDDITDSELSSNSLSSLTHKDSSKSLTAQQNISKLLSANLQPRVDLTRAVVSGRTPVVKHVDRRTKAYRKNKTVTTKSSEQIHLIRVTELAARRAIVALQLAPSMTNSPMKCNKQGMI